MNSILDEVGMRNWVDLRGWVTNQEMDLISGIPGFRGIGVGKKPLFSESTAVTRGSAPATRASSPPQD